MEKSKTKNQKAFSLIEIVLVMFIIASSFTGIYLVLSKNSQHEKDNRYNLIAANLAQEGIEIIRNRRDENLLNGLSLNDGLSSGDCYPYWGGTTPYCNNSRITNVELDSDEVYRNCSTSGCGSDVTIFSRICRINTSSNILIEAECTVNWISPTLGVNKTVKTESYLTNWQENEND